ncbi:MAG: preprotein translocase subunit SecG [Parcubacteria group bacterium CG11_big_fil_rev_8_21_14_0_20_39_22]|nr:MAG: preprotein translocase subunit SecG [Parcubacteria group bacterium CG11_big_fil_rev_8_21_14_0_20_39_22]
MNAILPFIQIVLAILLSVSILMQQTGAGLGGAFGGSDNDSGFHTRRGSEKVLFYGTVVLAVLFAISTLVALII